MHLSAGGIGCTVTLAIAPHFYDVKEFRILGIIWLAAAALADVLITASLVWHLVRSAIHRSFLY